MKYLLKEKHEKVLTDWNRFYILFPRVVTDRSGRKYIACCEHGWRKGRLVPGDDGYYPHSGDIWEWEYTL